MERGNRIESQRGGFGRVPRVAYFCMEYGLHERLPIYAGGLGVLAGDVLKAARDLRLPMVGIGIAWKKGYTTQLLGEDGRPYDVYRDNGFEEAVDTGVRVEVRIKGKPVKIRVRRVDCYGNAPLYLLDTDLPENDERWITDRLYGGPQDVRIAQEIVLGIGGVRALRALGIPVDVYHFNEGHAVFAGLELVREKMKSVGVDFREAWRLTRPEVVFTTHTPVPCGNECHEIALLEHMGVLDGFRRDEVESLGGNPFNMTLAGLRLASVANAVSRLHWETARKMWGRMTGVAPIMSITNGVHEGTWQDPEIKKASRNGGDLWAAHLRAKELLISFIAEKTGVRLNQNNIIVGFARRAAQYKRGDLILRDAEPIEPLLESGRLQLVFSGKAHPDDRYGKDIVSKIVSASKKYPKSVVFIQNYDIGVGRLLTRGCDVWLNTPQRPQEASGTSGMKAAMNGVLNLSVLDGWWPEGCEHGVTGWQVGDGYEGPGQDERDLRALHHVLLHEVLPTYYDDRPRWVEMMRNSISMSSRFTASRMLREYYQRMYRIGPVAGAPNEAIAEIAASEAPPENKEKPPGG